MFQLLLACNLFACMFQLLLACDLLASLAMGRLQVELHTAALAEVHSTYEMSAESTNFKRQLAARTQELEAAQPQGWVGLPTCLCGCCLVQLLLHRGPGWLYYTAANSRLGPGRCSSLPRTFSASCCQRKCKANVLLHIT